MCVCVCVRVCVCVCVCVYNIYTYYNGSATHNPSITAHFNGSIHTLIHTNLPMSKGAIAKTKTESESLKTSLRLLLLNGLTPPLNGSECEALVSTVPMSWERHSDLVVLPSHAFISAEWKRVQQDSPEFWSTVATALRCRRLARGSEISCDKYRSSCAVMLKGDDPWVEHNDNGIKYVFDVTHIMFSSGNIVEKLRLAEFDCRGQTIVDMYAGIGYFTLPYLVHAHADTVHACEWNPKAIEGLRRGLIANGVSERCIIHEGDCREVSTISSNSFIAYPVLDIYYKPSLSYIMTSILAFSILLYTCVSLPALPPLASLPALPL